MSAERYAPSRRPRWGTLALVALLHLAALAGLVRVFAPDFTAQTLATVGSLITVTITAPPEPEPEPLPIERNWYEHDEQWEDESDAQPEAPHAVEGIWERSIAWSEPNPDGNR